MKFKKSFFEQHKPINKLLELVDGDGSPINGDTSDFGNTEIQTGPINKTSDDDSNYEKDISPTTDKMVGYHKPHSWQNFWSAPFNKGQLSIHEQKDKIKNMLEALVKNSNYDDIVKRNDDNDINNGKTIEDINNKAILSIVNTLIRQLNNGGISNEDKKIILKYINSNA